MSETPSGLSVPNDQGGIHLPADELTVPSQPEQRFPIRHSDWHQLRRKLARIKNPAPGLAAVAWTSIGVAAGAGVAYLPWTAAYAELPARAQLRYAYISPTLVVVAIATIILAIALFVVNRTVKQVNVISVDNILEDMEDIYAPYKRKGKERDDATSSRVLPKLDLIDWVRCMPLWHH